MTREDLEGRSINWTQFMGYYHQLGIMEVINVEVTDHQDEHYEKSII